MADDGFASFHASSYVTVFLPQGTNDAERRAARRGSRRSPA
jgi:hypothetical protein